MNLRDIAILNLQDSDSCCIISLMISMNLRDIAILNLQDYDYCCIISLMRKKEAIKLLQNGDLTHKSGAL